MLLKIFAGVCIHESSRSPLLYLFLWLGFVTQSLAIGNFNHPSQEWTEPLLHNRKLKLASSISRCCTVINRVFPKYTPGWGSKTIHLGDNNIFNLRFLPHDLIIPKIMETNKVFSKSKIKERRFNNILSLSQFLWLNSVIAIKHIRIQCCKSMWRGK